MGDLSELVTVGLAGAGTGAMVIGMMVQGARDANTRILRRAKPRTSIKLTSADGTELTFTSESASEAATFLRNYLDEQETVQRTTPSEDIPRSESSKSHPVTGDAVQAGEVESD